MTDPADTTHDWARANDCTSSTPGDSPRIVDPITDLLQSTSLSDETAPSPLVIVTASDEDMDLQQWPGIPVNLALYTLSVLRRRSDSRLNGLRDSMESWKGWDTLTGLANYHSVIELLFSLLEEDSTPANQGSHIIATEIFKKLSQDVSAISAQLILILGDSKTYKEFLACRGSLAQGILDVVQDLLDSSSEARPLLSKALIRLSRASGLHPRCFALSGLEKIGQQVAAGGFGDVWKGLVRGETVAVKMMRLFRDTDVETALKQFGREALIWRQLSHPNLLPFYGLYYLESRLCLVSPWMENGHVLEFLKNAPAGTDRLSLILDVAMGLEYLHKEHIVHGDLKAMNILITPSCRACIADFGLSTIADAVTATLGFTHSTANASGGTARYQAPELLTGESPNHSGSDVYAFGCVCYEILTGKAPFYELLKDITVSIKVISGHRPSQPEIALCDPILWLLLQDCWQQDSNIRPSVDQIIHRLVQPPIEAKPTQSATDWDETSPLKFRRQFDDWPLLPSVTEIERQIFGDDAVENCINCSRLKRKPMFGFDLGLHSRFPVSVPRAPHNFNPSSVLWPEDAPQYRDSQPYSSSWASVSSPRLQRTNSWHGSISAPLDPTDPDLSNPKSFGARQSMPRHQRPHSWSAIDAPKWWLNDANPYLTNTPTTPIQIHPWLNGDAPSSGFYFDLAPGQFCPIRIVSTTLSTALGPELSEPAFYPPLTKLRILHPCIPYWPVDLNPSPIRLGDVLVALHRALQLRITHTDWETLSEEDKHAVARAWKQRYHAEAGRSGVPPAHLRDREEAEKNQGVKRVDFLQGKTVFRGLVRAPGDPDGCVRLLTAPARYDLPPLKPLLLG